MTLVVDASVVVAALIDDGEVGRWARPILARRDISAPHVMAFEVANILRRAALRGDVSDDVVRLAHADLLDTAIEYVSYEVVAPRAWELRGSVTLYDAVYVALAEASDTSLLTLDLRVVRAPGPRCSFLTPWDPLS
ncbi:type II toxin-antitoxin system VapC family toxin [Actinomycetospora chiangmaiensis]|uniref:type II toxin-antitoxin system VapC family toxin n=1 Tax=Actinomycetospora chiangmaiensis TaxID=402650 RepID=UPI0003607A56|nr:type II toxin-antitoxin system VapC family toxin [Actinomycetospora chiangmaiensis]